MVIMALDAKAEIQSTSHRLQVVTQRSVLALCQHLQSGEYMFWVNVDTAYG